MASTPPARLRALLFGAVVTMSDILPPRLRYGYVHRLTRVLLRHPLPTVGPAVSRTGPRSHEDAGEGRPPDLVCALLADHLDIGGIGTVIEMLATGLAAEGVRAVVICHGDGVRADRLRDRGVEVHVVADRASADAALTSSGAEVLQLHSAPAYLEEAAIASGRPLVTVMHNTEIHYTRAKWTSYRRIMERSTAGIAVSETVRAFHAQHLTADVAARLTVVPNGAPMAPPAGADDRRLARAALQDALGAPLGDDTVFLCLARYDSQKNIAGAVVAFARALRQRSGIRLIFAGDPSDRAEFERARALRDLAKATDRIHFLGNSDAGTLLAAADAFLLDSFFEGWPVAATEAQAAGLPLVLSEMGGARELVERDPGFSRMTPNPAGDAAGISDRLVRHARRRTRRQNGSDALTIAVLDVAELLRHADRPLAPRADSGIVDMLDGHAAVLHAARAATMPPLSGDA